MKLSALVIEKIKEHPTLKNQLAIQVQRSEVTIRRWLKTNHQTLTAEACLRVIEKETGLSRSKILTK